MRVQQMQIAKRDTYSAREFEDNILNWKKKLESVNKQIDRLENLIRSVKKTAVGAAQCGNCINSYLIGETNG